MERGRAVEAMDRQQMMDRMRHGRGFIAALDQSGGSTPKTLLGYGLAADAWADEHEMFGLIHAMRGRILTSPAFTADKVLAAILFERTMEGCVGSEPVPQLLHRRGIVPFVKIDRGLETEHHGVRLMRPIPDLERTLGRAAELGMFGTKARSLIGVADPKGIAAVVAQQFELGERVAAAGLVPILEPEYAIDAPDRAEGEAMLREALLAALAGLAADRAVILKLSIPVEPGAYRELVRHPRVVRLAALSGGYTRREACQRLARTEGMIASFSRALLADLRVTMSDAEFDRALGEAIEEIYRASVDKAAGRAPSAQRDE